MRNHLYLKPPQRELFLFSCGAQLSLNLFTAGAARRVESLLLLILSSFVFSILPERWKPACPDSYQSQAIAEIRHESSWSCTQSNDRNPRGSNAWRNRVTGLLLAGCRPTWEAPLLLVCFGCILGAPRADRNRHSSFYSSTRVAHFSSMRHCPERGKKGMKNRNNNTRGPMCLERTSGRYRGGGQGVLPPRSLACLNQFLKT